MLYLEFDTYFNNCKEKAYLVKIVPEIETDSDVDKEYVTKTKETYEFCSTDGWEDEAECQDALAEAEKFIKECCALTNCTSHKKKFKKGKYSKKDDEVVEFGKYIVTVEFKHEN